VAPFVAAPALEKASVAPALAIKGAAQLVAAPVLAAPVLAAPVLAALARVAAAQLGPAEAVGAVFGLPRTGGEEKFRNQGILGKYNGARYLNTHPCHFVSAAGGCNVPETLPQWQAQALLQI
jgi:hypothetical protein